MQIDTVTYRRDLKWGIGDGCEPRPPGVSPSSLVIHTTNGKVGSSFANEAGFLRDNHPPDPDKRVSANYLVGKQGQIAQIVPDYLAAWHVGPAKPAFTNAHSLGIEAHLTPGEAWMPAQREALTWLTTDRMRAWGIPRELVDTHRAVALPPGRKTDPASWDDAAFYRWRATLGQTLSPDAALHQVIGVRPSISLARFTGLCRTRKAPFSAEYFDVICERIYTFCGWLDVDPAFWLAVWTHEQFVDRQLGNSDVGKATFNPLNVKAYDQRTVIPAGEQPRWPRLRLQGAWWNAYEDWQLGCLHSVLHVKQIYGAIGLLYVETIIPKWAPGDDGNSPASYRAAVLADMRAMQEVRGG